MKQNNLKCPIRKANPYRRMAAALKGNTIAPRLLNRQFRAYDARKVLLTDTTYLFYGGHKRCYLSVIMDAYTKQVLSYVVGEPLEEDFVLETVNLLIEHHGISMTAETLINSDQGCHYTSKQFIEIIKNANLRQSMSRKANCWDNAPQECFFGHMKDELDISNCLRFNQVQAVIRDWMDYYNKDRYQWILAKLSPDEFYVYSQTGIYPLACDMPKVNEVQEIINDDNNNAICRGSAPAPPRFIAFVSRRAAALRRKRKAKHCAALPQIHRNTQVAPQRCLILCGGKASIV